MLIFVDSRAIEKGELPIVYSEKKGILFRLAHISRVCLAEAARENRLRSKRRLLAGGLLAKDSGTSSDAQYFQYYRFKP